MTEEPFFVEVNLLTACGQFPKVQDTNNAADIFVHDRWTGETTRVSVDSAGGEANAASDSPSISADGRYVVFSSNASNLILGDTNQRSDIFLHDRLTGGTTLVSVDVNGLLADGHSYEPKISADGSTVAFRSIASDLVVGGSARAHSIYVRDLQTGVTELASPTYDRSIALDSAYEPALSADGRFVTFRSAEDSFIRNDANALNDVFVFDRQTDTMERVSMDSAGLESNGASYRPSISGDGRYVAFESEATNLVGNDTNGYKDIFVHDRDTDQTWRVSVASDGTEANYGSIEPVLSENGRFVMFSSGATNISTIPAGFEDFDVFAHDLTSGTTWLVTLGASAGHAPSVRADGRFVASWNPYDVVANDTNGKYDIYFVDTRAVGQGGSWTIEAGPSNVVRDVFFGNRQLIDFGDAYSALGYPVRLVDDGARHAITGPYLGSVPPDAEFDCFGNIGATSDDLDGDDEDGVTWTSPLVRGSTATVEVVASGASFLNAWIDFSSTNAWTDAGEQIFTDEPLVPGTNWLTFTVPATAALGDTYARFRLNSTGGLSYVGLADDGEVEDYRVKLTDSVSIRGTEGDDMITVTPGTGGSWHQVDVTSGGATESYSYDPALIGKINIDALGGNDAITIHGTDQDETVTLNPGSVDGGGQTYRLQATNVETITVNAGTGSDTVTMTGSAGSNRLYSYAGYSLLGDSSRTFSYRANGFDRVTVNVPTGGRNYAFFYDSPQNDTLDANPERVVLNRALDTADATTTTATGFQRVYAYGTQGGVDDAALAGSAATAARFYSYADYSLLTDSASSFYFYASGFESVTAEAIGTGYTYAYLYDSPGADLLAAGPTSATMDRAAPWSDATAKGFKRLYAYSTRGGSDTAQLAGNETGGNRYYGYPTYSTLSDVAGSFYHYVSGFRTVTATGSSASTSSDRAWLYDSAANDTLYGRGNQCYLEDTAKAVYHNEILYFDYIFARSTDDDAVTDDTVDVQSLAYYLLKYGSW